MAINILENVLTVALLGQYLIGGGEMAQKLLQLYDSVSRLILYRNILDEGLVKKVNKLLEVSLEEGDSAVASGLYHEISYDLIDYAKKEYLAGDLWREYLLRLIILNENAFSLECEKFGQKLSKSLYKAAKHDFDILLKLYFLDWREFGFRPLDFVCDFETEQQSNDPYVQIRSTLQREGSTEEVLDAMINYYHVYGCGNMGLYHAFRWGETEGLIPIKQPDSITFQDLIGYQDQKEQLIENTESFVRGSLANNILLFGDRGTGKSSSVKALGNKYASQGLRLIELSQQQLKNFPDILQRVRERGQRFIVFIDDLSFEEFETEYKYLKAIIEGSIEAKPDNVLIYATSNRRNLIKESWKEREGDDIHAADSMQEKLSLVDRFGITITFTSPDQEEYLSIVTGLADTVGLELDPDDLREEALKWAVWHKGRSGRTARHFINYMLGKENSN